MSAQELITEHLDLWTGAVRKKSSSGRGSNGKIELAGVKKLRELILNLAVRGKLVPQNSEEPSAALLLVDIEAKKKDLHHAKTIKKPKKVSPPQGGDIPWTLPSCWEWVRLPDIYYPISPSGKKLKSSETLETGQFPVVDQGQSYISGYTDDASLVIEIPHPVIVFGDHTTARKYIDFNFVPGADGTKILCPILVNPRFFYLQLLGYDLENRGYARHFKVLNENFFALPPLEEQHRIVQKVDELMALCDRLEQQTSDQLEAHETLVDTLLGTLTQSENATELADNWARLAAHFDTLFTTEQSIDKLKQTILQLAVMGRLVEHSPSDTQAPDLLKAIQKEKDRLIESTKIKKPKALPAVSAEEQPYTIPEGWLWSRIGSISLYTEYGTSAKTLDSIHGIPVVKMGDIQGGNVLIGSQKHAPKTTKGIHALLLQQGDLLYNRTNSPELVGKTGIFTGPDNTLSFASYLIRIKVKESLVSAKFLNLAMNSPLFRETEINPHLKQQCGQANVNGTILKQMRVPLPPREEQTRIVQKVDELMALCNQLQERLNQASETRCQLAEAIVEKGLST